ncbi:MAG TPA: phosphoribosyltransferase family protein [Terrimesophilobacter sp.]|nr:phosphoribosyltransferase family protein [Terrimesophilobacter sp.]HRP99580.1 phosphoribosyltransferase family protein [Terrimesophilobacter sp.]
MAREFDNREHAGRELAALLARHPAAQREGLLVLALPRGGVPVAAVIADELAAPLDVLVVRKLGVPHQPEVAMGAIASLAGTRITVTNADVVKHLGPRADQDLATVTQRESEELLRRESLYRADRPPLDVTGRPILLVDDGVATGATIKAVIEALRVAGAASVAVAVPVAPADTLTELAELADDVVCVSVPDPFWAVGQAYTDFRQTSDDDVVALLAEARER